MSRSSRPSPPSSNLVDATYQLLWGLKEELSTLDLYTADPDRYLQYCTWYENRLDTKRFRSRRLNLETRIAAYLRLVAVQGQRFCLGSDGIPSSKWLRERLDIHRNTMGKYIKDAQTTGRVQLSLNVGCQLAFAAAIYPRQTKLENEGVKDVLANRLDLIDDYHITGKSKADMVGSLTPIVRSGKNGLFTVPKSYPCIYDLDARMRPMKRSSQHIANKDKAPSK